MTALPGWLTPLRRAVLCGLAATGIGLTVLSHRHNLRNFAASYQNAVAMSAALSADVVDDWVQLRQSQAATAASAASSVEPRAARTITMTAVRAMVARGRFAAGRVVDSLDERPILRARALNDSVQALDFSAPMLNRDSVRIGWVVLTARMNEAALSHFNPTSPDDATQRTSLFVLADSSASLLVSSRAGAGPPPDPEGRSIPAGVQFTETYQRTVLTAAHPAQHGEARGLTGAPVYFGRAAVPGAPLMIVRERAVSELHDRISQRLLVTNVIFLVLTALVVVATAALWRGAALRRENQSQQLRSAFIASVSHELRTPLTQIRMYAEMLRLGLLPNAGDATRALGVIEKESERLSMLVERALRMTRDGALPPPGTVPTLSVASAAEAAVTTITPLAAERRGTVHLDVPTGVTARIEPDALHQILLNLLDNAIKYGPAGQEIRVSATRADDRTQIAVADQGPGVPRDERDAIWTAFTRGRHAEGSDTVGSGIGLAVVADLTKRYGGRAWVESPAEPHAPHGARFVVELPSGHTDA